MNSELIVIGAALRRQSYSIYFTWLNMIIVTPKEV